MLFSLLLALCPLRALAGPGLYNYFVLPAASAAGQLGTYFRTDVYIVNPYTWKSVTVRMWFLKTGLDNSSASPRDILVPAGGTKVLPDIVLNTFGTSGGGALILDSSSTSGSAFFLASARTYTGSASGTYGLLADGIDYFNGAGAESLISGVRNGSGFRTNTIVVSTSDIALSMQVTAYDSNGNSMGSRLLSLPPFGHQQLAVADFASFFDTGYLVWTCVTTSGSVGWVSYATPIDNASGDSSFVLDRGTTSTGLIGIRTTFLGDGRESEWSGPAPGVPLTPTSTRTDHISSYTSMTPRRASGSST